MERGMTAAIASAEGTVGYGMTRLALGTAALCCSSCWYSSLLAPVRGARSHTTHDSGEHLNDLKFSIPKQAHQSSLEGSGRYEYKCFILNSASHILHTHHPLHPRGISIYLLLPVAHISHHSLKSNLDHGSDNASSTKHGTHVNSVHASSVWSSSRGSGSSSRGNVRFLGGGLGLDGVDGGGDG